MFATLLTALLSMLPRLFVGVISKILSESAVNKLLENIVLALMRRAARLTKNTIDDDFVQDTQKRFDRGRAND